MRNATILLIVHCCLWMVPTSPFSYPVRRVAAVATSALASNSFYSASQTSKWENICLSSSLLVANSRINDDNDHDRGCLRSNIRRKCLQKAWTTASVLPKVVLLSTLSCSGVANAATIPSSNSSKRNNSKSSKGTADFNVCSPPPMILTDIIYPNTFLGRWKCQRVRTRVKGDRLQAELAWKVLGGGGGFGGEQGDDESSNGKGSSMFSERNKKEAFDTAFFSTRDGDVILDRGFDFESRLLQQPEVLKRNVTVHWEAQFPNTLEYEFEKRAIGGIDLTVVQRNIDTPAHNSECFGFNEMIRIRSTRSNNNKRTSNNNGGIFSVVPVQQSVVQIERRYRILDDGPENRVMEGLEVLKTYLVLDNGIVRTDVPTSTTRSRIRLSRSKTQQTF